MRSSLISRSPFLSTISVALLATFATFGATGCSGDDCGPGGASASGLVASSADATLTFGAMKSRAGNDCPDPAAPTGVVSLSIEGKQTDGTGLVTFCIPRPDQLAAGSHTLGTATSTAEVRLIDLQGSFNSCTFTLDTSRPPSGDATGSGVCGNGTSSQGFALHVDGAMSLRRTCGSTTDSVAVTLSGTVAVAAE